MKNLVLPILWVLSPLYLFCQDLSGLVVDETKSPIAGAYIIHLQSDHHAHTNEVGVFLLKEIEIGDSLQVMHIGYETKVLVIKELKEDLVIPLEESIFLLDEIVVGQNSKSSSLISAIDLRTTPVQSSQEILRSVPGLFIGQHAGGGKAEQIFLRGFDIDHGTDISITVDGMPVNMVSHAHGQGYADLHFLIPETVDFIDFGKGPYYADKGNFATAGYIGFKTKESLDNSSIRLEQGSFNTTRALGMFNVLKTEKHNAYIAGEYLLSDGPFESSQNGARINLMAKYTAQLRDQGRFSILASHFTSTWDASGQVPVRAVESGQISRFGAIDDTEGGKTGRTNIAMNYSRNLNKNTFIKSNAYYSRYDFELFSNFTFFLEDPINGDQIRQKENRQIFGFQSEWNHSLFINNTAALFQVGVGLRSDDIDGNLLSRTLNRKTTLENIQFGDVNEQNLYTYVNADFDVGNWLFQPSVRLDYFKFNYIDNLQTLYDNQTQSKAIVSPKMNIVYNFNKDVQLFFRSGVGFHSNDSRVVLSQAADDILPAAYGADLGAVLKPGRRLVTNIGLWYLFLEQEFVYVGDAGIVEPSGQTRRLGVDFGLRYQLSKFLFANGDINYTYARSVEDPEGENFIPLAPDLTATGGLNFVKNNITAGINFRYLKDRAANEDNSIVAEGYFITDMSASYTWKNIELGFAIQNLFDSEWNETQFATESRLGSEQNSVEEIHFTPGAPFFIKGTLNYKF